MYQLTDKNQIYQQVNCNFWNNLTYIANTSAVLTPSTNAAVVHHSYGGPPLARVPLLAPG